MYRVFLWCFFWGGIFNFFFLIDYPCKFHSWSSYSLCVAVTFQWHDFGILFKRVDVPGGTGHLSFLPSLLFTQEKV